MAEMVKGDNAIIFDNKTIRSDNERKLIVTMPQSGAHIPSPVSHYDRRPIQKSIELPPYKIAKRSNIKLAAGI